MRTGITLEADTGGAVAGLSSAREEVAKLSEAAGGAGQSIEGLGQQFKGLKRVAPDAGAGVSMLEQGAVGLGRSFGLSSAQARILQIAIRTLTGALGPVAIALGVLAAALAVIQRRKEQAEEAARRLEEAQEAAAEAAREHARALEVERDQIARAEQAFFDLRLQILDYADAEAALAARQQRIAALTEELGDVRIKTMEDAREAIERLSAKHDEEARELEAVRARRAEVIAGMRAMVAAGIEVNQAVTDHISALTAEEERLRRNVQLREQQMQVLRRMLPLLRSVTEATREDTTARRARSRAIREEIDVTDQLLAKIKEEAEAVAEAERIKAEARGFHSSEQARMQLEAHEEELRLLQEAADEEIRLLQEAADEELRIRNDMKAKRERIRGEEIAEEEKAQRKRERMAVAAADRVASALNILATRSFREALGAIGGQLQAEGIQRTLQGAALSALGNPQGAAVAGVGAAMTAAGTAMRAAGGGGGGAVAAGTVAPSSGGTTNQTANVQVNVAEGVVSDPQQTASRVAGALEDVARRGLWPEVAR